MAAAILQDELNCSICLNVYTDPVMLRCGHNFCSTCIGNVLTAQERSGTYSCPECRMKFEERPALQRNFALKNISDRFRSTHPDDESSVVLCTYCIHTSAPAVKMCVHCEASLCEGHIKVHIKSSEHVLIEPTTCLENRKCSKHKKILEYFCYEDSACICVSCRLDEIHSGHQVESIEEVLEKEREKLKNVLEESSSQKEKVTMRIQTLLSHKDNVMRSASRTKDKVMDVLRNFRKKLAVLEEKILSLVDTQEEEASNSITKLIQNLEENIENISEKIKMCEKMYNIEDPLLFLQDHKVGRDNAEEACTVSQGKDNDVKDFQEHMIYVQLFKSLFNIVNQVRSETLNYEPDLILDEETAGQFIDISKDFKTVTFTGKTITIPKTSKRFLINQVLSKNIFFSGQHYWEIETSETGIWRVGVAYTGMDTKDERGIGCNKMSWCLERSKDRFYFLHDNTVISLPHTSISHSFGVYLDCEGGRLSFYELCDPIRHVYSFHTTFTEPLHAAFVANRCFVKIIDMAHEKTM